MAAGGPSLRSTAGLAALVVVLLATALSACSTRDGATPSEPEGPVSPGQPGTTPTVIPSVDPGIGDEPVEAARADLVERFGYDPAEIGVDVVEHVEWRDSALGCPLTEHEYEPGPVAGYRIVLRVGELTFNYHGAEGDAVPFLCQFLD